MRTIVVDASVSLKWQFRDEPDAVDAERVLNDYVNGGVQLIAPSLWPYEIVNAVQIAVRRSRITVERGRDAVVDLMSLGIHLYGLSSLAISTFDLAARYGLSAHGSAYLALSLREGCDLCMVDRPFYDKVKSASPRVTWVSDYR